MEDVEKINRFLAIGDGDGYGYGDGYGDGYGYGYGDGSGDGYGYGDGSGDGYGSGYGDGYGDGYGSGYGDGYGIKTFDGQAVYYIDNVPTLIYSVAGNYAQGAVVKKDLTLKPCYIAREGNCFAHGDTLHEAREAAQAKYDENRPLDERIADFVAKYPTLDTVAPNTKLFEAHHTLTGSCLFGRRQFAEEHNIDVEHSSMTVAEFIELTKNAYGGDVIKQLAKSYNNLA